MQIKKSIQTCKELLSRFEAQNPGRKGQKINFSGVEGKDVYNITSPFEDEGNLVIAGRVEGRDTEFSKVMFFTSTGDSWSPIKYSCTYDLQDPFQTRIFGELVFGGVKVWPKQDRPEELAWRTVFYRGSSIRDLKFFAEGPVGMKDIRLTALPDGRIGVFTRPQGEVGGRGKIGFTKIGSLEELTSEVITGAKLVEGQFDSEEWGGVNELHSLKNGLIGALGHIACFDRQGSKHYYSMTFSFDPDTFEASRMKLIAIRDNFAEGEAKRPDLRDTIFSGGMVRLGNGMAELYAGVSDAEAHRITIRDPFLEYEG